MTTSKNPDWWTDYDTSAWDRISAAMRRDWEQTRHDLSGGRAGADLNQNLEDTVGQAAGRRPIPPTDVPNPLDGQELRAKVERAQREMRRAEKTYSEEAEDTADRLTPDWDSAEAPLRYGYAAARRYGPWKPVVAARVREEWGRTYPERPWDQVEEDVRFAWEQAAAGPS